MKLKLELDIDDANVLLQALSRYNGPFVDNNNLEHVEDKRLYDKCVTIAAYYRDKIESFLMSIYENKKRNK